MRTSTGRFDRGLALSHSLGGWPGEVLSFVSIVGSRVG
jgi:hypothetical protein